MSTLFIQRKTISTVIDRTTTTPFEQMGELFKRKTPISGEESAMDPFTIGHHVPATFYQHRSENQAFDGDIPSYTVVFALDDTMQKKFGNHINFLIEDESQGQRTLTARELAKNAKIADNEAIVAAEFSEGIQGNEELQKQLLDNCFIMRDSGPEGATKREVTYCGRNAYELITDDLAEDFQREDGYAQYLRLTHLIGAYMTTVDGGNFPASKR